MRINKIGLLFTAIGLSTILMVSCKKEEKKIANLWKLTAYIYDGNQQSWTGECNLDLRDDKTYSTNTFFLTSHPGNWALSSDKGTLILFANNGDSYNLKILKLESKDLWFQEVYGSHTDEYHWAPK